MMDIAESSATTEPEPPPSIFNMIPGGSLVLQIPGSGLLLQGENLLRGVVASGLRWVFGNPPVPDVEQMVETSNTKYNALHSAVQELVEMFDEEPPKVKPVADITGIELLRATKLRMNKLESDLKAERQARQRAEIRIAELENIKHRLNEQIAVREQYEIELNSMMSLDREVEKEERELEDAVRENQRLQSLSTFGGLDLSDFKAVEDFILRLQKEVDDERHHRFRAEIQLGVMKEMHSDLLVDQDHRNFDKANAERLLDIK